MWDLSSFHAALSLDQLTQPVRFVAQFFFTVTCHFVSQQLFCMAWSPNGNQLATFAKDHVLSIFEPRSHLSPVSQMEGPIGSRGARLVWLEDSVIAVSGFNKYGDSYRWQNFVIIAGGPLLLLFTIDATSDCQF